MTDQEFHPHVERWLGAHHECNRLSRLIQQISAATAEIKLPKSRPQPGKRAGQNSCLRPIE